MKPIVYSILFLTCCGLGRAQTNTEPAQPLAETNIIDEVEEVLADVDEPTESVDSTEPAATVEMPEPAETHIYSDSVELGIKSRSAVYRGNVRLEDPRIYLTCEQLTANVPEKGTRVEQVVAETNVVILLIDEKGNTNRAYADKAVYTYSVTESGTNEVVELSGDSQPRVERVDGTLHGDVITWDRARNTIIATNQRMTYRSDSVSLTNEIPQRRTNSPATKEDAEGSDPPVVEDSAVMESMLDE